MNIKYAVRSKGSISEIEAGGVTVPFYEDIGPSFYYRENRHAVPVVMNETDRGFSATVNGITYSMEHLVSEDTLTLRATIQNNTSEDFCPEAIGLKLGINSYMIEYPQWNDKFFPSYLRCEKTHFTGYFMSPMGKLAAVTCAEPVAAWELDYNAAGYEFGEEWYFGHRIYTGNLLLTVNDSLPERHPQNLTGIPANEEKTWLVHITPLKSVDEFKPLLSEKFGLPVLDFENYTLAKGETAKLNVSCPEAYTLKVESPGGKVTESESFVLDEYGVYTATLTTESGKICQAKVYSRHDYGWYLKAARKNAVYKPQKASTHTESWYGHYSAFLAKKHYPEPELDRLAQANFDEIMPYMFNIAEGDPLVCPWRVQNNACLVSLLVDIYESDPAHNEIYLDYADKMADFLIGCQTEDGAYRNVDHHYTAVIYIAKSMLELALCEKELGKTSETYQKRYETHYRSAKAAVDDLKNLAERMGTEGEHTLEDGMITCSALQLGFFALTLPEEERAPYVAVAEHLMSIHGCLEEMSTPDCRMRGASLRFWEAQYDVMIRGNMMNSPHGWTSWKNYATYYLYLLTGKEAYLKDTIDTMGACLQMVDENENLRWAFIKDPYLRVQTFVPDTDKPVKDGYESTPDNMPRAYRGKYSLAPIGEEYVDMISDWYRVGEQKVTGGYECCDLYLKDDVVLEVDNQGGACDNDVHEHFKCLEETLLKKAFVIIDDKAKGYNCSVAQEGDTVTVTPLEECDFVHVNTKTAVTVKVSGKEYTVPAGMKMIKLG